MSWTYDWQEDAFAIDPAYPPGDPISEEFPNQYSRLAANWYWTTGYTMSSQAVHGDSLLSYWAKSQDPTKVRWYILLSGMSIYPDRANVSTLDVQSKAPVEPTALFVPRGLKDVVSLYEGMRFSYRS